MSSRSQLRIPLPIPPDNYVSPATPQVSFCVSAQSGALLQDYLEQAGVCCEQARQAATMRRMRAACGLFGTAIALYRHILQTGAARIDEPMRQQIEENLRQVEQEVALYQMLCVTTRAC
jgi:hypothetical protein